MSDLIYKSNSILGIFEHYIINLKLRANYQPIVLRHLLINGRATKTELANTLNNNNKNVQPKIIEYEKRLTYFRGTPVFNVLLNHLESFVKLDNEKNYYLDLELSNIDKEYFEKLLTKLIHNVNEVYIN